MKSPLASMFSLARCMCLTALILGMKAQLELDLRLLNTEQLCVDELLGLLDNPTSVLCREYATCLVLGLKLHQTDMSSKDIEDNEEPYQQELIRMSVDCDLSFASVISQLTGQATTPWPTTATTVSTTITTSATTKTATTTTRAPTYSTTTSPIPTFTETTKLSLSTTAQSTSTTTPSPTTTTASPSTSKITQTTTTPTTPRHITTTTTKSMTTTATAQTPSPRVTSSSTSPKSSSPTTDSEIPGCIPDTYNGCAGRPDGHYPACFPVCKKGVYITCTNGRTVISECQFGWYKNPQRQRFLARIMFHPATKRCEYKSAFCPRELDSQS